MDLIFNILQSPFLLFFIGSILIFYGSNVLIDNSILIAKTYSISPIIIGLTVIAFGTSLPELVVSIMASIKNEGQIVLGNILGSNIANIALVLGSIAIFKTIDVTLKRIKGSIIYLFVSTVCLSIIILYGKLDYLSGFGFLLLFSLFIFNQFKAFSKADDEIKRKKKSLKIKYLLMIIIGISTLGYGSNMFIDSAIEIATLFKVPTIVISVSLVAFGTSVPELVTSVVALNKGESGFVIGNILGSNIINILLVLGASLTLNPIPLNFSETSLSLYFFVASTSIFILILLYQKSVNKFHGLLLLIIYSIFIYFQFSVGSIV